MSSELFNIRPCLKNDLEKTQQVLNDKSIIQYLGGFTMLDVLKNKLQKGERSPVSLWVVENSEKQLVGATMFGGRPQAHLVKYGEVGVLEKYRRNRLGSALYLTMTIQGILEGRRLFEDTIVGDNPTQFKVLPTLGLDKAGELRHRTASCKSIVLFQFSLLDVEKFSRLLDRVPNNITMEVVENLYTIDLFNKNIDIYKKHIPSFIPVIQEYVSRIKTDSRIKVVKQDLTNAAQIKTSGGFFTKRERLSEEKNGETH